MSNLFILNCIVLLFCNLLLYRFLSWDVFKKYFAISTLVQIALIAWGIYAYDTTALKYFWFPIDIKTEIFLEYKYSMLNFVSIVTILVSCYCAAIFEKSKDESFIPYILSSFFAFIAFGANDLFVFMSTFIATTAINTKQFVRAESGKSSFLNYVVEFGINLVIALLITHAAKMTGSSSFEVLYLNEMFVNNYRYILFAVMLVKVLKFSIYKNTEVVSSSEFWLRSVLFPFYVLCFLLKAGFFQGTLPDHVSQLMGVTIMSVLFGCFIFRKIQYRISMLGVVVLFFVIFMNLLNKNEQTFKFGLFLIFSYQILVEVFIKKLIKENYYILRQSMISSSADVYIIRAIVACVVGSVAILMGLNHQLQKVIGFDSDNFYNLAALIIGIIYILMSVKPAVDIDYKDEKESPFDNPDYNKIYFIIFGLLIAVTFIFRHLDSLYTFKLFGTQKIKIDNILVSLVFISLLFCFILWSRKNKYVESASNAQFYNYFKGFNRSLAFVTTPILLAAQSIHWIDSSLKGAAKTLQYAFLNTSYLIRRYEKYELTYSLFLMSLAVLIIVLVGLYK
ncbi:MAG: hypothetical protein JNM93_09905 [Bacteriovoracaceae bacterium]|nr:hypothetical protein [Bacteriovoracaceae bacterium]